MLIKGHSRDIIFSRNLCDATGGEIGAYQTVMLEDIQRMTIAFNDVQGPIRKAFAFDIGSTGGKVIGNRLDPRIPCHVGMDESSEPGYLGAAPPANPDPRPPRPAATPGTEPGGRRGPG